jgi:hypothetical protein
MKFPYDEGAASEGRRELALDTGKQGRYREVSEKEGMRNAKRRRLLGTYS